MIKLIKLFLFILYFQGSGLKENSVVNIGIVLFKLRSLTGDRKFGYLCTGLSLEVLVSTAPEFST